MNKIIYTGCQIHISIKNREEDDRKKISVKGYKNPAAQALQIILPEGGFCERRDETVERLQPFEVVETAAGSLYER